MHRRAMQPRTDWPAQLDRAGVTYHSLDGGYWREDAAYEFSQAQVDCLDSATASLHRLCIEAVERIIREDRFADLRIPEHSRPRIIDSYERQEPSLYGRFDFWYDGVGSPKLLEYNADTPTSLVEAAVGQWEWWRETCPETDQFNCLHERLIEQWRVIRRWASTDVLHLVCLDGSDEDRQTVTYLADTANQAGWHVQTLPIEQIGWEPRKQRFMDHRNEPISTLFKLYPWEWMCEDAFAAELSRSSMLVLEPAWKQVLSHKGLLALLWEWYPDHPNLLPAFFSGPGDCAAYVRKPFWSREGANISIVNGDQVLTTAGPYDAQLSVYQQYVPLPVFERWHPVIGSWVVGDEPAGMGIREDRGLIYGNHSRFVPHFVVNDEPAARGGIGS
ncbi:MAG: glutathionylspermidine synthase family protein [Nitrospira sp.]|nr:glutathionylspermidine synthase family protein [Nitrospira sp.]